MCTSFDRRTVGVCFACLVGFGGGWISTRSVARSCTSPRPEAPLNSNIFHVIIRNYCDLLYGIVNLGARISGEQGSWTVFGLGKGETKREREFNCPNNRPVATKRMPRKGVTCQSFRVMLCFVYIHYCIRYNKRQVFRPENVKSL